MKKLPVCAAFSLFIIFFSCRDSTSSSEAKTMSDSSSSSTGAAREPSQAEKNTANMRAVYKGVEMGDMSAMDGFVAEDIVDHDGPHGEIKGRDSIKKILGGMHNHIDGLKIELISDATGGDYHFALSRLTGKTKDAGMGMPANTPISDTSVDLVKIHDGKVVEHWSFQRPHKMPGMGDRHSKKAKM